MFNVHQQLWLLWSGFQYFLVWNCAPPEVLCRVPGVKKEASVLHVWNSVGRKTMGIAYQSWQSLVVDRSLVFGDLVTWFSFRCTAGGWSRPAALEMLFGGTAAEAVLCTLYWWSCLVGPALCLCRAFSYVGHAGTRIMWANILAQNPFFFFYHRCCIFCRSR